MRRREFLEVLAVAAAAGLNLRDEEARAADVFYALPPFGNVGLLHITDCHAQLRPVYLRESDSNLGVGAAGAGPAHLTGEALLHHFGFLAGSREAYALTALDFPAAAQSYGRVGGFAHLATLVKQLRADRPGALLLDGGDTWQGSATALWTQGQDMVLAARRLGVDVMTAHWEFTLGAARVEQLVQNDLSGHIAFLAQNVHTADFGDPVFEPYVMREINGVPVAIIGQAYPYTRIAHPRHLVPDWTFGIEEASLQQVIDAARHKGAAAVVLLSHNGIDIDLKLAGRITGLDVILGGHTHAPLASPILVRNRAGVTVVTNAGSNGKFLGVLDLDVRAGRVQDFRYRLLPVFANLLEADAAMDELITQTRAPFVRRLAEPLAVTEGLLYRRDNFNGSFDQLILDALLEELDAEIAFSPGFRWGTTLLPGEVITFEDLMNQTAISYPQCYRTELSGAAIKDRLEDICDNLFNPDPYRQEGGDMVRVAGLHYTCDPKARLGRRIQDLRLGDKPLDAARTYRVAGWAPVDGAATEKPGEPIWELVARHLRALGTVPAPVVNRPLLNGSGR